MALCVQYGCGTWVPEGWENFDVTPALFVQNIPVIGKKLCPVRFPKSVRYGDICKGLPIADGTVDKVYCSHVLEHLAVNDMRRALRNTLKMLRPGGLFRLVIPDLRLIARQYLHSTEPDAGFKFVETLGMGRMDRRTGLMGSLRRRFGNSAHFWMWDFESMEIELKNTGFVEIRRAVRGDSGEEIFTRAEQEIRWEGALGIQCQKPK
jgi:SAM-dependent methyltransferase